MDEELKQEVIQGLKDQGYEEYEAQEYVESLIQDAEKTGDVDSLLDKAERFLYDLHLSFVSAVDQPAQDSRWLQLKSENKSVWGRSRNYVFKDNEKQIAYAPVLVPGMVDKQGDVIPSSEIERCAHDFLENNGSIDLMHDQIGGRGEPVESWLLQKDEEYNLPSGESKLYPEGTWMMAVKFEDEVWDKVKSGELTGFSIGGVGGEIYLKNQIGKPFAGFENFQECVTTFEDDPEIDDPEAFCGWLEEEFKNGYTHFIKILKKYYKNNIKKGEDGNNMTENEDTSESKNEETEKDEEVQESEEVEQSTEEEKQDEDEEEDEEEKEEDEDEEYDKLMEAFEMIAEETDFSIEEIESSINALRDKQDDDEDEEGPGSQKHPNTTRSENKEEEDEEDEEKVEEDKQEEELTLKSYRDAINVKHRLEDGEEVREKYIEDTNSADKLEVPSYNEMINKMIEDKEKGEK